MHKTMSLKQLLAFVDSQMDIFLRLNLSNDYRAVHFTLRGEHSVKSRVEKSNIHFPTVLKAGKEIMDLENNVEQSRVSLICDFVWVRRGSTTSVS